MIPEYFEELRELLTDIRDAVKEEAERRNADKEALQAIHKAHTDRSKDRTYTAKDFAKPAKEEAERRLTTEEAETLGRLHKEIDRLHEEMDSAKPKTDTSKYPFKAGDLATVTGLEYSTHMIVDVFYRVEVIAYYPETDTCKIQWSEPIVATGSPVYVEIYTANVPARQMTKILKAD